MNTPSPLVPQGANPEPRRKSPLAAVFIILAVHLCALSLLLLQGCGKNETPPPSADLNPPVLIAESNSPAPMPDAVIGGLPTQPPPPGVPSSATPVGGIVSAPPSSIGALPPPGGALPVTPTAPAISLPPPISPAPIEPAPSTPSTEHTVMRGETGAVIAKKYGMGWKAIEAANPGVDSRKLKIGQKLMIPAKSIAPNPMSTGDAGTGAAATETYTVKSGDTLGRIAKSHGVTIKAIKSANNLKLDAIKVGQKLKIPSQPAPAPVAAPAPAPTATAVPEYAPSIPAPTAPPASSIPPYTPPPAPGLAPISPSSLPPPPRP